MWAAVQDKNREGSGQAMVGNPLASSEKGELQLQTCHMVDCTMYLSLCILLHYCCYFVFCYLILLPITPGPGGCVSSGRWF